MLRRLVCALVAGVVTAGLLATPAGAHHRPAARYYLALGDSLAYGIQPTGVPDQGYPHQLYASLHAQQPTLRFVNLACPGETSRSMHIGGVCAYPDHRSQLDAALAVLRAHRHEVKLITIDLGGNDITSCLRAGVIDRSCIRQALWTIWSNLSTVMARLRAAAPGTTIVGMNYYDPALANWFLGPSGQDLARESVAVINRFNRLLTGIYHRRGARVADVARAFSTTDFTTQVNGTPLNVVRICQWTWMCAPAPVGPDIHANQAGYGVIAQTFHAVL
jgi:lysophospholipase L1-like esterase